MISHRIICVCPVCFKKALQAELNEKNEFCGYLEILLKASESSSDPEIQLAVSQVPTKLSELRDQIAVIQSQIEMIGDVQHEDFEHNDVRANQSYH